MAITRAQIAKQLLANGGRIGLANGSRMDSGEAKEARGEKSDFGGGGDKVVMGPGSTNPRRVGPLPSITVTPKSKPDMSQIQAMLDRRFAVEKPTLGMRARNVADNFLLSRAARGLAGLFSGPTQFAGLDKSDPFGGRDEMTNRLLFPMMAQGPRTMDNVLEEDDEEEEKLKDLRLVFRAEGGSMNDQIRQAMLFGGAVKAVKKAVRGVKKVAKSPIGKAAIAAATLYYMPKFGIKAQGGLPAFLQGAKVGLTNLIAGAPMADYAGRGPGLFSKFPGGGIGAAITAASLLPLLGIGTGDESEEEAQTILKTEGIDIDAIRANPNQYLARAFKAEGGSIDEPVAKKTMPLLDMGGQEMDLRAEGGFVPIGRMEKADDVPARLSKNEFVFTADAVRNAGDGNVDKGAEVMYNMMKNLEAGGEVSEESQGLEGARKMFQTSQRLEEVL